MEFWEITKTRLATAQKALRRMSLELEQHEFQHSVDIKAYRDRIRALVAENAAREADLQATAASVLQQKVTEMEKETLKTNEKCREEVLNALSKQIIAENAISECQIDCQRQITEQRLASDKEIAALQLRYDEQLQTRMAAAEESCHSSMYGAAQQRDTALANASAVHETTLRAARDEHAATVAAQLDLIAALKNDVLAAKQREAVAVEEIRKLQNKLKSKNTLNTTKNCVSPPSAGSASSPTVLVDTTL